MHSLPAMFTLPIYAKLNRLRWLTTLIVLIAVFGIVPFVQADYWRSCRATIRHHAHEIFPVPPEYNLFTVTYFEQRFTDNEYCYERYTVPWWQVNATTH